MKAVLGICVLWSLSLLHASNVLAFVHLGKQAPDCLFTVIEQARYLNPDCDVYLLGDEVACQSFSNKMVFLKEKRISLVDMSLVAKSPQHRTFYEVNKINPSLREGYWMYATERFFYLYDFMESYNLTNLVHLESDSMLYMELSELLPFLEETQIAAPFQSLKGCIPCFVFIKNAKSLACLLEHILSEMERFMGPKPEVSVNDMQTLASFYAKFGKDFLLPLPSLMPEYAKYHPKRRSRFVADNGTPLHFLSLYAQNFPGLIFDAAALGIFINGNDRRDTPLHGPGTIHARSLFDPSFFSFFWGKDGKDRDVPYLAFKGVNYRIVNMHFHSKMPQDYASFKKPLGELPVRKNL